MLIGAAGVGGALGVTPASAHAASTAPARSHATPDATALVRAAARPDIPAGAHALGAVASSQHLSGAVGLVGRDAAGLAAYATAVNTPGSSLYHHYLTPATFRARFGPTNAAISAVAATLRADGLSVGTPSSNGLLVPFSAPARTAAAAFHTSLATYKLASGRTAYANTSAIELPAGIASSVQSVLGLNDLVTPTPPPSSTSRHSGLTTTKTTAIAGAATACPQAVKAANAIGSLTYDQVARSYGLDPLFSAGDLGAGQTIALFEQDAVDLPGIKHFDQCYFGATKAAAMLSRLSFHNVDGGYPQGALGEAQLDVEDISAIAPDANIQVWDSPATDSDGVIEEAAMVDQDKAQFLSESYGDCEPELEATYPGYLQLENTIFEQAAAQGETFMSSSADNGSDTCSVDSGQPVAPLLSVSDPASQPFVMGVGGTAITAATDPVAEEVWNDGSIAGAGGGGISSTWPETSWQSHDSVPGLNDASIIRKADSVNGDTFCQDSGQYAGQSCREVPDVSLDASPNTGGIVIYLDGQWIGIGGTSSSSPLWAAILADINSQKSCQADPIGFAPPKLYALAANPVTYAASFNDVTVGNNDNFGASDGLFPATRGYDMATGLGSAKVTGAGGAHGLAYYLCGGAAATGAVPTVSSVSPTALPSAGGTLTVTGTGFSRSSLAAVSVGAVTVPASAVTVSSPTTLTLTAPSAADEAGSGASTDGGGSYLVSVTTTAGATSAPSTGARVSYLGSASTTPGAPSVSGVDPSGGNLAGGTRIHVFGSGFSQASNPVTSVTIGGAQATGVTVLSDTELTAVTPASSGDCLAGDDPTNDVCQTEVVVSTQSGSSQTDPLVPEFHGKVSAISTTSSGGATPVATEFDYAPRPTLTGITIENGNPAVSEAGGDVVELTGTGLGALTFNTINVGSPTDSASIVIPPRSFGPDGTSLTFVVPKQSPTATAVTLPVSVQTFASALRGGAASATPPADDDEPLPFAPTPTVSSLSTGHNPVAGPTSGGQLLTIHGSGFTDLEGVVFVNHAKKLGSQTVDIVSATNTKITLRTPAALTGTYKVEACGLSGCSAPSGQSYIYYLPGNPVLTSVHPGTGKAGATLTVTGQNLGWLTAVYFGGTKATTFSNKPKGYKGYESGSTTTFTVKVPAGVAVGRALPIQVLTVESRATGYGKSHVNRGVTFTRVA